MFETVSLKSIRPSCKNVICQFVEQDRRLHAVIDQTSVFGKRGNISSEGPLVLLWSHP